MRLSILENGSRETLKGVIHAFALGLSALIASYNTAAWLQRRQRHLAVNAIVYIALVWFEVKHVRHHFADSAASAALLAAAVATAAADELPAEPKAA
jgi:hypothetical protein